PASGSRSSIKWSWSTGARSSSNPRSARALPSGSRCPPPRRPSVGPPDANHWRMAAPGARHADCACERAEGPRKEGTEPFGLASRLVRRIGRGPSMVSELLAASTRVVVRFRGLVVVALVVVTVVLALGARKLHVEANPDRLLPQEHPYIQTLNDLYRTFGDKNLVVIGLFPHDGVVFTPAFLAKVAAITNRIEHLPGVNPGLVTSIASPQVKDIRGTADGIEVEPIMETPPTDAAGAEAVRRRVFANEMYMGTLVAADGTAAGIQASFDLTEKTPDYLSLYRAVTAAVAAENDGTFDVTFSGPVVYAAGLTEHTARTLLFFPLALVVIG